MGTSCQLSDINNGYFRWCINLIAIQSTLRQCAGFPDEQHSYVDYVILQSVNMMWLLSDYQCFE